MTGIHWRWFAIYSFHEAERPELLRLLRIRSESPLDAFAKAVYGDPDGGIAGTVHVHTVMVQDYSVPSERNRTVRWWDGEAWHDPV